MEQRSDSWGARRKRIIEMGLSLVGIALIAIVVIATVYRAPTCTDGKQDGGELGIDCGGPCPYLCDSSEASPTVEFVRPIQSQPNRTDIIAYVDNSNSNAQLENVEVTVQLYNTSEVVIAQKTGTINLPPSSTEPVFLPDFYTGNQKISQAFLEISTSTIHWLPSSQKPSVPVPSMIQLTTNPEPKVTATVTNTSAVALQNIPEVITLFDKNNNAVGASETLVQSLPGEGTAQLVYTWNYPFAYAPVREEILRAF